MKKMIFGFNEEKFNIGLVTLRVLIGFTFVLHGYPKVFGGVETWNYVGSSMGFLGFEGGYASWGLMAAPAEFVGGLLLMVGLFVRPALVFLLLTMLVAIVFHYARGEGFNGASHAIEDGIIFICLIITGGGKYALDTKLFVLKSKQSLVQ